MAGARGRLEIVVNGLGALRRLRPPPLGEWVLCALIDEAWSRMFVLVGGFVGVWVPVTFQASKQTNTNTTHNITNHPNNPTTTNKNPPPPTTTSRTPHHHHHHPRRPLRPPLPPPPRGPRPPLLVPSIPLLLQPIPVPVPRGVRPQPLRVGGADGPRSAESHLVSVSLFFLHTHPSHHHHPTTPTIPRTKTNKKNIRPVLARHRRCGRLLPPASRGSDAPPPPRHPRNGAGAGGGAAPVAAPPVAVGAAPPGGSCGIRLTLGRWRRVRFSFRFSLPFPLSRTQKHRIEHRPSLLLLKPSEHSKYIQLQLYTERRRHWGRLRVGGRRRLPRAAAAGDNLCARTEHIMDMNKCVRACVPACLPACLFSTTDPSRHFPPPPPRKSKNIIPHPPTPIPPFTVLTVRTQVLALSLFPSLYLYTNVFTYTHPHKSPSALRCSSPTSSSRAAISGAAASGATPGASHAVAVSFPWFWLGVCVWLYMARRRAAPGGVNPSSPSPPPTPLSGPPSCSWRC